MALESLQACGLKEHEKLALWIFHNNKCNCKLIKGKINTCKKTLFYSWAFSEICDTYRWYSKIQFSWALNVLDKSVIWKKIAWFCVNFTYCKIVKSWRGLVIPDTHSSYTVPYRYQWVCEWSIYIYIHVHKHIKCCNTLTVGGMCTFTYITTDTA